LAKRLTLSFSGRYDKNEDFKGQFTPRATALFEVANNNNIRVSYQTAYRFPSTQQKYINLNVGDYTLLGGLPWILDTMNAKGGPILDATTFQPYTYKELKPESCRSFEIGYKGVINKKLLIDAYTYFGDYKDFLGRNALFATATGKVYSTVINSSTKVKTHGFGLGFDYLLPHNYYAFINAYSDVITDVPTGFQAYFNAPKYKLNAGFANSGLGKKKAFGFNVMMHWQDAFQSDGDLATGPVKAFTSVDAQVNYQIKKINSVVKIGGTNIFNKYYKNGYGNPEIGGLYYVSIGYNLFK
jgi:outer membrane receptor protein involved in Fe transport